MQTLLNAETCAACEHPTDWHDRRAEDGCDGCDGCEHVDLTCAACGTVNRLAYLTDETDCAGCEALVTQWSAARIIAVPPTRES